MDRSSDFSNYSRSNRNGSDYAELMFAVAMMLATGLRLAELGALRRCDIDFASGVAFLKGKSVIRGILLPQTTLERLRSRLDCLAIFTPAAMRRVREHLHRLGCSPQLLHRLSAIHLVQQGAPLAELSRLLGHSSVAETEQSYPELSALVKAATEPSNCEPRPDGDAPRKQ